LFAKKQRTRLRCIAVHLIAPFPDTPAAQKSPDNGPG